VNVFGILLLSSSWLNIASEEHVIAVIFCGIINRGSHEVHTNDVIVVVVVSVQFAICGIGVRSIWKCWQLLLIWVMLMMILSSEMIVISGIASRGKWILSRRGPRVQIFRGYPIRSLRSACRFAEYRKGIIKIRIAKSRCLLLWGVIVVVRMFIIWVHFIVLGKASVHVSKTVGAFIVR